MVNILLIDDNQAVLNYLKIFLLQKGKYNVTILQDSLKAYQYLADHQYDILLLDMDMPEVTGLDILKHIDKNPIDVKTIVLTGVADIDLAISAMKYGTFDYLLKPIDEERLIESMDSAVKEIEYHKIVSESPEEFLYEDLKHKDAFKDIITRDIQMWKIFHIVEKFAVTDNSILIWGESGTGKELIAKAIHEISNRKERKFIAVNAGAFANELFASEFFGYAKGAFTGAEKDKKGFIEEANGGTLFLDEIGELSLPIQVKLLRFLQDEEFYRLGSTKNLKVNVRIIAATNKNLFDEINKGSFRKDLFFRLNINSINLPPLRERNGDIHLLANHFLSQFNAKYKKKIKKTSAHVMNFLQNYSFPGNVREMINIINSAIIVEAGNELTMQTLPYYLHENDQIADDFKEGERLLSLQEVEKEHIKKILTHTGMNNTKAAEILGISRVNLIAKIKKYGIEKSQV